MAKSKLGETKEALEDYSKAIELDPQYTKAYQRRAELNLKAEKYQEAVHDYSKAKELEPESRGIFFSLQVLPLFSRLAVNQVFQKFGTSCERPNWS